MTSGLIAVSEYIPKKEGLLVRVDMSSYLIDYYLHRKDHAPQTLPEHDEKLKDLIACFAIHLSARTGRETHAWTVHIVADQPYSLFVTGNTGEIDETGVAKGYIVGHILTDHIRHTDVNSLHAQCTHRGKTFTSMVQCDTSNIVGIVEQFYAQSEQHPIKIKMADDSDTAIGLVGLPEYDEEWIRSVEVEHAANSPEVDRHPMRTCEFAFLCDCSPDKLMPFLSSLSPDALQELYGSDQELQITCPRCGKRFEIKRSEFPIEQ